MRLRNIKGSREVIAASPCVIHEEESRAGTWKEVFGNDHPLHIEIGMGKGQFIMALAKEHPQMNYIGIEKYSSVLIRALEKMAREEQPLSNLYFIRMDAERIGHVFAKGEVERIYLNFSDPWPKERHAGRRLTSTNYLTRYEQILAPGGRIEFKTDNRPLFDFSVASVQETGWTLQAVTYDLHRDRELMKGNIMTEYEERFSAAGNPIHKLIALPGADRAILNIN
ncbi:MAG: tRNA (guanosine(46)-N7)-methyltransferase TrmB [Lachnospiraceae bacterium]